MRTFAGTAQRAGESGLIRNVNFAEFFLFVLTRSNSHCIGLWQASFPASAVTETGQKVLKST